MLHKLNWCLFSCRCSFGGGVVRNFMTRFYTKLNETKSYHSTLFPFLLIKFGRSLKNPLKPSSNKNGLDAICDVFYSKDIPSYFVKIV